MPDESCRKCGGLLLKYTVCAECRAPNQFICRICGTKTMIKSHDGICFNPEDVENVVVTLFESWQATKHKV